MVNIDGLSRGFTGVGKKWYQTDCLPILLVKDNEIDAECIVRGFRHRGFESSITIAQNGLEALQMLRCHGGQNSLKQPYLIVTDINMPLMNGTEFLRPCGLIQIYAHHRVRAHQF